MIKKLILKTRYSFNDTKLLIKSVPSFVLVAFVLSIVFMNIFANKEISTGTTWLALDCGICISWITFLIMDVITKHFGPSAAVKLSILAMLCSLVCSAVMIAVAAIPGNWAMFYEIGDNANSALNKTFGGTWYVILGSNFAFLVSSIVNAVVNAAIGKLLKKDNAATFMTRTYISTFVGQFVDNFVFSLVVSHIFFGWSLIQCVTCSLAGCVVELICEAVFSPMGYAICRNWKRKGVGSEYMEHRNHLSKGEAVCEY